jgi:hypothetical protein
VRLRTSGLLARRVEIQHRYQPGEHGAFLRASNGFPRICGGSASACLTSVRKVERDDKMSKVESVVSAASTTNEAHMQSHPEIDESTSRQDALSRFSVP